MYFCIVCSPLSLLTVNVVWCSGYLGVAFRFDNGSFYPPGNDGNYDKVGGCGGEGYNINVPWPHRNFGDADYLAAWEHVLMPVAREFNPDMVLISAGFDSG